MTQSGLPTWGVVAQVKASAAAVETFVAWHLERGASRIVIYFDDPDDPAAAGLARLAPRVAAVRCDAAHWAALKPRRPGRKTGRQTANAQQAYDAAQVDWLAHVDVDEFIVPLRFDGMAEAPQVADMLAETPAGKVIVRLRPYEALAEPGGGEPRHFRTTPLSGPDRANRVTRVYGPYAEALADGMLSHSVGKTFARTGVAGLAPRIHVPRIHDGPVRGVAFSRSMVLVHYHAVDRADWLSQLDYRTELGAYSGRPASKAFFAGAGPGELAAFHQAVQIATPELLDRLGREGLLMTGAPALAEARARVFGVPGRPTSR